MSWTCDFKPELITHPIGEFHCPICHEMQFSGLPHTDNDKSDFDVYTDGVLKELND
jgi:hypothetical protein